MEYQDDNSIVELHLTGVRWEVPGSCIGMKVQLDDGEDVKKEGIVMRQSVNG